MPVALPPTQLEQTRSSPHDVLHKRRKVAIYYWLIMRYARRVSSNGTARKKGLCDTVCHRFVSRVIGAIVSGIDVYSECIH